MIAARSAVISANAPIPRTQSDARTVKIMGLAFVVIVCALFWMGIAILAGQVLGYTVSARGVLALGSAISLFLTLVCAPVMLRE